MKSGGYESFPECTFGVVAVGPRASFTSWGPIAWNEMFTEQGFILY